MTTTVETLVPEQLWQAVQPLLPHLHAATAADLALTTVQPWPGSSTSCAPASPGGCYPHISWAAAARSPAGGGCVTGSAPVCGSSCTTSCSPNSAAAASSTGRGRAWARSACAPSGGGELTGPNPVDRGKPGSKYHLLVDRRGIPLAVGLSAANTHDSVLLEPMVDAVPAIRGPRGRPGRPRKRPAKLHGDKGYDYPRCRRALGRRGITPRIARRGVESSQRLGRHRYEVERSLAWLVGYRRLQVRYERRADLLLGFLHLAWALICLKSLHRPKG